MSGCVHKVKLSVRRPEKCKLNLSVSHYKDRIVAPEEYSGATTITPSDDTQTIPTKDKLVRADVTVLPAPTEPFSTTENGQFTPSEGNVGFSSVTVDVEPILESLTVTENGLHLPPAGVDGFDRVTVDVPQPSGSIEITENGTYNVEQYAEAVVNNPAQWTSKGVASGAEPSGEINLDGVTLNGYAFTGNSGITKARGKNINGNGAYHVFNGCSALTEWNLHFTSLGYPQNFSANCPLLQKVVLKIDASNGAANFLNTCPELQIADFDVPNIRQTTFPNCHKFQTLIIRNTNRVVSLDNVSAFDNTPFRGYDGLSGTVYVPQAYIESYKTANTWKTVFAEGHMTFLPLEESEWASKYADGTPVNAS